MAVVYNQAVASRFGIGLIESLEGGDWASFEVAVAWVRRSGTRHLLPALKEFLEGGRRVRFVVGVDIENTSKEGLEDLLSLQEIGDCTTFIYHNEAACVFHPKVYLFSNEKKARLIVGSNNLTESGLFRNTEMALEIDVPSTDPVITDVRNAFASWQDTSESLAKVLDEELLNLLVSDGYVVVEELLRKRRREAVAGKKDLDSQREATKTPLFGSRNFTAPMPPEGSASVELPAETNAGRGGMRIGAGLRVRGHRNPLMVTNVLLMRVRPARGTQVQIPIPLKNSGFFSNMDFIVSGQTGESRVISATHPERAGGAVNTFKVEMQETAGKSDPVVRLDRTATEIRYEVYDANSIQGREIMKSLQDGRNSDPPTTILTKPNDPAHSTWYRFV